MDELMKLAFEIVKAQAMTKPMTVPEMMVMAKEIANGMKAISEGCDVAGSQIEETTGPAVDPKKSIRPASITCCECGKVMKLITTKHLAAHGLDKKSYCEKFGLKKGTTLACKDLVKARKAVMAKSKIWEKVPVGSRGKKKAAVAPTKKAASKAEVKA